LTSLPVWRSRSRNSRFPRLPLRHAQDPRSVATLCRNLQRCNHEHDQEECALPRVIPGCCQRCAEYDSSLYCASIPMVQTSRDVNSW
jgi:hypothetical protein